MSEEEAADIETSDHDLARLYREMRSKGAGRRQLEALRANWSEACMDPMRRGVLRDPPSDNKLRSDGPFPEVKPHRDLGNLLEPNPPSIKDVLKRTEPFDPAGQAIDDSGAE